MPDCNTTISVYSAVQTPRCSQAQTKPFTAINHEHANIMIAKEKNLAVHLLRIEGIALSPSQQHSTVQGTLYSGTCGQQPEDRPQLSHIPLCMPHTNASVPVCTSTLGGTTKLVSDDGSS